jgi:mRNA-degrading endonuclease RelE of RelBE toxin-antitoxin system
MKEYIKELLRENLLEDYPTSWSIEEFKKLNSFNARIKYCNQHLTRISSGSSRVVYKIDDEKVLKLAKNKKGLAQNEV